MHVVIKRSFSFCVDTPNDAQAWCMHMLIHMHPSPLLHFLLAPLSLPPDEVDAVSPENSPPLDRDREYSVEEALFLKKNFESLEKSEGLFLNVPNPRLSISAKFLERNMR